MVCCPCQTFMQHDVAWTAKRNIRSCICQTVTTLQLTTQACQVCNPASCQTVTKLQVPAQALRNVQLGILPDRDQAATANLGLAQCAVGQSARP